MLQAIPLPVTSILTAVLLILLVLLSGSVTVKRGMLGGVLFGDDGNEDLRHRVRAHGNFIEIVPMVIIAIGLMEYAGASSALLWTLAGTFAVGRALHALRFYLRNQWLGVVPIVTQHIICLTAGGWLLNYFLVAA